jgi:hypothetical protein
VGEQTSPASNDIEGLMMDKEGLAWLVMDGEMGLAQFIWTNPKSLNCKGHKHKLKWAMQILGS